MTIRLIRIFILMLFIIGNFKSVNAQQQFIEGELTYKISIVSNKPEQTQQIINGTLHIKTKSGSVLKELVLDNGFTNTKLIQLSANKKFCYTFIKIGDKPFALQNDMAEIEKQLARCQQMELKELPIELNIIANFSTQKASLSCNDRKPIILYYTNEWQINNPYLFEEFASFQKLPLAYTLDLDDGSKINFELKSIKSCPINSSDFFVPKSYKIISQEEFKSWQH